MTYKGIQGVAATSQGSWFSIQTTKKLSIHVYGSTSTGFDATVQIRGSNKLTQPSDSVNDVLLAQTTAEAIIVIDTPVRWMKHMISSHTAGTIYTASAGGYEG